MIVWPVRKLGKVHVFGEGVRLGEAGGQSKSLVEA